MKNLKILPRLPKILDTLVGYFIIIEFVGDRIFWGYRIFLSLLNK